MDTINIKKVYNKCFSSICSIQDNHGNSQKIESYQGILRLFLNCFGIVQKVRDQSTRKIFYVNKSQYAAIKSASSSPSHKSPRIPPKRESVNLYTNSTDSELHKKGIFLTCNENSPDQIAVSPEILYALPKGHYYTVHLTTDRLNEQIDHAKIQDFLQKNPEGRIIAFRKILNAALFKMVDDYQDTSNQPIPTCTLFYPPTKETNAKNKQTVKIFF